MTPPPDDGLRAAEALEPPDAASGATGRGRRTTFVAAALGLQGVKLAVAFAAARWLAPREFADWNKLQLLVQYSTYAQLGVTMGLNRDLSILLARREQAEARGRVTAGTAVVLATATLFAAAGVAFMGLPLGTSVAFAALPVLTALVLLQQSVLRSSLRFGAVSRGLALEAAGWALLVMPFVVWRQSTGFVAVADAVLLGALAYYRVRSRGWLTSRVSRRHLRAVVASGVPLCLAAGTATVRQTGDLLVALHWFDVQTFAALAVALIFVRILMFAPTMTALLFQPELGIAFGAEDAPGLHRRTVRLMSRYVPLVGAGVLALTVGAWLACQTVLPRYEDEAWLVALKTASEGAVVTTTVCTLYLSTIRRTRVATLANLAALVPYAAFVVVEPTRTALGAAIATSAALYVLIVVAGFRAMSPRGPA